MSLPLRVLAPAKINLGLFLGATRDDGRHELVTVMQSISLADELTLRVAPAGSVPGVGAAGSALGVGPAGGAPGVAPAGSAPGVAPTKSAPDPCADAAGDLVVCPGVPGSPAQNIAAAALAGFRLATGWAAAPLELRIEKRVPVAAGLGGGSGDAAAALRLAAAASGRGDGTLLLELARGLGADVPAQVCPGRWLARGAGELLQALPEPRDPCGILVLPANTGLSTAAVYAQADRMGASRSATELEELHGALARELADGAALPAAELLANDLQEAARALCPEIEAALAQARAAGADVALVSGSGPTVLGLFAGPAGPARARTAASRLLAERRTAGAPAAIAAESVGARFAAVSRERTAPAGAVQSSHGT